ncbi:MAG: PDZ domain-containing protein [Bacteroidota bacterium]
MKYTLHFQKAYQQIIDVHIESQVEKGEVSFHLPAWRPGRYETQNFATFVFDASAKMEDGTEVPVSKTSIHTWQVDAPVDGKLHFTYSFFANLKDAGGTYFDEERILVNGITLLMYRKENMEDSCEMLLDLPSGWKLGGGFHSEGHHHCFANFHELVDTPFLASKDLFHHEFVVSDIPTHLWFMGDCTPDFQRLEKDIVAYSEAQMKMFGEFPVDQYHYLFVAWPFAYRHGVEHVNSTVIVMGPGFKLMEGRYYDSLLEISSHELFHTWNVKQIRPEEMYPYDYSGPNYSRLHYVTEGVTTYYGDLMLWKGNVWGIDKWIRSVNGELQGHYYSGAQDFISLEEASIQSWTNGYKGDTAPNRKISFYTKGYLIAMLLDMEIREASDDAHNMDELMYRMYHEVAKAGRGYTADDFKSLSEELAGKSLDEFWDKYISGTADLIPALKSLGDRVGMALVEMPPPEPVRCWWGMAVKKEDGAWVIDKLYENSPATKAGMHIGDEIIAIGGRKIVGNINEWLIYLKESFMVEVHYFHQGRVKTAQLPLASSPVFKVPQFVLSGNPTPEQIVNRRKWQSVGKQS